MATHVAVAGTLLMLAGLPVAFISLPAAAFVAFAGFLVAATGWYLGGR